MRNFFPINPAILFFILIPYLACCQYSETFSSANKGILSPGCTGPGIGTCSNVDFTGVNWTITGNFAGIDTEGFLTVGGVMSGTDVDEEVCWVSPVLNLTGPANISVDLTWVNYDFDDKIDLEWEINGSGNWIQLPNQTGQPPIPPVPQYNTSLNTIGYTVDNGVNVNGSLTVMATSIGASGNTLKVRVCGDNTGGNETFTLDNVSVTNGALPVKWGDVVAKKTNEGNQVSWATYKEVNNDYFEIERSVNGGTNFEIIGTVKGAGNTNETNEYTFIDQKNTDQSSVTYYRIKQTDFDGRFEYSSIVAVKNEKDISYNVSPNPFTDKLTFSMNESLNASEKIIITDMHGKTVKEITSYNGPLDTTDFASGIYFVRFPSGEVSKIIKP
ncbi:MAG TPA: T9SS type A sorting domain-containing protein [Saprospiraceae bacterium]|nr:T9SS type A sorting domain-containing protein [Saprospiraceae bacterium]HMU02386.1 T9SS type A sorting domain-containing protein [Saprospiraceae bacterium]